MTWPISPGLQQIECRTTVSLVFDLLAFCDLTFGLAFDQGEIMYLAAMLQDAFRLILELRRSWTASWDL